MPLLLQASARASELPGGYGVALLQTLLALAAVCILAWVVLRWSAQRGLGIGEGQRIKLVERVALDAKRTAFLVEVGGKLYFLAAGEAGPPALVAELDPREVPEPERKKTFLEILRGSAPATSAPPAGAGSASDVGGSGVERTDVPPIDGAEAEAVAVVDEARAERARRDERAATDAKATDGESEGDEEGAA